MLRMETPDTKTRAEKKILQGRPTKFLGPISLSTPRLSASTPNPEALVPIVMTLVKPAPVADDRVLNAVPSPEPSFSVAAKTRFEARTNRSPIGIRKPPNQAHFSLAAA